MLGIHDFWLFVAAGLLLNVTPGPDMAYIVARSAQLGWRGGATAALAVSAGCLVHIAAAALGVSALLAASALAFTTLKWIGAAYLVYLGIRMLLAGASAPDGPSSDAAGRARGPAPLRTVFWQGFLTNALNPKVALFFLAFLPQFIRADAPSKVLAFAALGLAFNLNGTLWNLGVAWCSARLASVRFSRRVRTWLWRTIGGIFVLLGARLALAERP
jgi:threonine/homoserine/homoserine lactone efflux protein